MVSTLPPLLADWVAAYNAHDSTAFAACFADDAVVRDEGQFYFGRPAIFDWFEGATRNYRMTLDVTDLTMEDGEPVLHGRVSGEFEGSPLEMRYYLGLDGGKIVALKTAA